VGPVHGTDDGLTVGADEPGNAPTGSPDAEPSGAGTPTEDPPAPVPLLTPRDGVPDVIDTPEALADAVAALAAGSGPVAVDAERASGHRYGQRAFLVPLRRAGAGTLLVDPAALPDLSSLGEVLAGTEWVLHAASQDLPCLAEVGMRPRLLFDTELGSRLAGFAKVGLAAVVQNLLGFSLAKEHSAVDWSTRPLPAPWLRYAALDVEVLVELRDVLAAELDRQGKLGWAREEFAAVAAAPPPAPRPDPWRRTSGVHRLRTRRQLAVIRELWTAREELARTHDVSPGRLVPDGSLVEATLAMPGTPRALVALPGFTGRGARRYASVWAAAIARGRALPDPQLPPQHLPSDGPPPARAWADRDPLAAARLARCRAVVTELADRHRMPVENLLAPDSLRRLAWTPPEPADAEAVAGFLRALGARSWQLELTVPLLVPALRNEVTPG
jgi:ribonuclease D